MDWLRLQRLAGFACLALTLAAGLAERAASQELQGAGSTFVTPVMARWIEEYGMLSGVKIAYDSVGSGAGIRRVEAGEVDFGASDKPLTPTELEAAGLGQFPVVVGGVVPVVNLPGVSAGQMRFSGALLADIFMGRVTRWDADEIKALNPDLRLPAGPITVVHRSDGSGSTYNLADFLAKASPTWRDRIGVGLTVGWPVGIDGAGTASVAAAVRQTEGAIGYVEYAYAVQSDLAFALVRNEHQLFIGPGTDGFQAAAATVRWRDHKDFSVLMSDARGPNAYPITATTFILLHKHPHDPARSQAVLKFFKWALEDGDRVATELRYAPLPPDVVALIEGYWAAEIKPDAAPPTQ